MSRLFRVVLRIFVGLLAVLVLASLVLTLVPIGVDLTRFKGLVETAASGPLGRTVAIDGDISATTSIWPTLEMEGLRLENPPGFAAGDLARMDHASVQVELLPLLAFKFQIDELHVRGVSLDLVRDENGEVNWAVERDEPRDTATETSRAATPSRIECAGRAPIRGTRYRLTRESKQPVA
jgi:uncharacterized protein involved in outer membrane biogenesis